MPRYPRHVDREYLSCRSGGLNKIQMIDGGTPDLDQDLVVCNRRLRYIVEHQLPTVFQQSDSFHASSPYGRKISALFPPARTYDRAWSPSLRGVAPASAASTVAARPNSR